VALESSFQDLAGQLRKLHDMLLALRLTVVEDKPLRGEAALVDHLEDAILDLMGALDECQKAAAAGRKAVGHPLDLDRARRALAACQDRFHGIEAQYTGRLASYEKIKDLAGLARDRRGEWVPWAGRVTSGAASKALARCWQEIAERVGTTSVSVRTSNIGQKIVTQSKTEDVAIKGLT
jgi:hypothetical protein